MHNIAQLGNVKMYSTASRLVYEIALRQAARKRTYFRQLELLRSQGG